MAKKTTKKVAAKKTAKKSLKSVPSSKKVAKKATKKTAATTKKVASTKAKKAASTAKKAKSNTKVVAKVDVGWGHSLYIRGEGPGLSWNKGVLMVSKGANEWTWAGNAKSDFDCKFLINDEHWSSGENLLAKANKTSISTPVFF